MPSIGFTGGRRLARGGLPATVVALTLVLVLAACGGSSSRSAGSAGSSGSSKSTASSGKQLFTSAGCAGCHTLAAAHATGSVGPDLDQVKPSEATVVQQVTNGGAGMPSFSGRLSKAQITAVAKFVASAAR